MSKTDTVTPGALAAANLIAPSAVRSLDVAEPLHDLVLAPSAGGRRYRGLAVLVRRGPTPLGWIDVPVPESGVVSAEMLGAAMTARLPAVQPAPRLPERATGEPFISVIVTTCANAETTIPCVEAILAAARPPFEVIVIDNRPSGSPVSGALRDAFGTDARIRLVEERRRGLSNARNAGVAQARGEIVALIDDDVRMDEHWFDATRRAFATHPDSTCVTGLILPLELETEAQLLIQRMASFEKGFVPRIYSLADPPSDQPLFPYTAGFFGSGANMAFRTAALRELGGFDPALGAGSPALGGEDLDIYIRLLLSGRTLAYEPGAIVWHRHPDTARAAARQALHYGVGLSAMATKQLLLRSERGVLLRRAPSALRYLLSGSSRKNSGKGAGYPRRLQWLELLGLAVGPIIYLRSAWRARPTPDGIAAEEREREPGDPERHAVWCGEFDVATPEVATEPMLASDGLPFDEARLLIRMAGEPAGFVHVALNEGRLDPATVWEAIEQRLSDEVTRHLAEHPAERANHSDTADIPVTVIVCTRNRPNELRGCLGSLQRLTHPKLELLVIDNAPSDDRTQRLIGELGRTDQRLRYVREPRPGLSCARNRGLREARGEVVAFTDDDVRVDPLWLSGLLRGFCRAPDVGCVTGLVASASLEHPAAQYFDGRVWWSSSCEHRLYRARRGPGDSRLHPYAAGTFGTGANIAFRTDVIRRLGGFDESLGAGSPTAGGEDLDAFVRLLHAGYALSYEPAGLVWHEHRIDAAELERQMYGYGKGLAAYLFKHLISWRSGPRLTARLLLALRHALVLRRRSRLAADQTGVPPGLASSEVRGLIAGPRAYIGARRNQSRMHVREVAP